jgi:hypothetical protein
VLLQKSLSISVWARNGFSPNIETEGIMHRQVLKLAE